MNESVLSVTNRERIGKGGARAARREGKIPAIVYGDGQQEECINVQYKDITLEINKGRLSSRTILLDNDGNKQRVITRAIQKDPVSDSFIHIDFLRLSKGAKIEVEIPVVFINHAESGGLKRGGTLNIVRHAVELSCPVDAIPSDIVIDLTGLELGDSVHIENVKLPENCTPTITDRNFTIATIAAPSGMEDGSSAEGGEEDGDEQSE